MRVVTVTPEDLDVMSRRLGCEALEYGPFDITVGILNGGARVARIIAGACGGATGRYHETVMRRPTSRGKERGLFVRLMPLMPVWMLDMLRKAESLWLRRRKRDVVKLPELSAGLCADLRSFPAPRVLVVDDAVDSGVTMKAVVDALRAEAPEARIVTAALTVTTPHPVFRPDVALFSDSVLLRFPWSLDYRQQ